jgi:hypothetical protein
LVVGKVSEPEFGGDLASDNDTMLSGAGKSSLINYAFGIDKNVRFLHIMR